MQQFLFAVSFVSFGWTSAYAQALPTFNYGEALQKSIYFYDAQRSGPLPTDNRVKWRGDSALQDGSDHGVDLRGGWYDAGDHVKFGFPMASSATLLAWGLLEYPSAYVNSKQIAPMLANLKWATDFFMKASSTPNQLWGQIGNGSADHAWWGSAEVMSMSRPAYRITAECAGSDLAGETAAALASASLVFRSQGDPAYSDSLLDRARSLYQFADTYRGRYSDCIKDAAAFYQSWSGYTDELAWGAAWLYRATNNPEYLAKAKSAYATLPLESGTRFRPFKWTHNWDDKSFGTYVLMSQLTGSPEYREDAERWLDFWTTGYEGQTVRYTPGGLAWLDQWGSLRYAANTSFLAFVYADWLTGKNLDPARAQRYASFAERQINYMLGDNPRRSSYVVGFGTNPPRNPHHRTAHGSWSDNVSNPADSAHVLYGALVGGPNLSDGYIDSRSDYVSNEVATDYNASFVGALARMYRARGGTPLVDFPQTEVPSRDQIFVQAKVNARGSNFVEIAAYIYNQTAWPARVTDSLSLRYFFRLDSDDPAEIVLSSAFNECGRPSGPVQWTGDVYYIEVNCSGVRIAPAGQSAHQKQMQFRIASRGVWNTENDWSMEGLAAANLVKTSKIVVYEKGTLVWGEEPTGGVPQPLRITTGTKLPTAIAAKAYAANLLAAGGTAPYGAWEITIGALPEGLTLNGKTGEIMGVPLAKGATVFEVRIADSTGSSVSKEISISVDPAPPLRFITDVLGSAVVGAAYSVRLQADGGAPPYTWSVAEGRLPTGLTLAEDVLDGTPTTAEIVTFTLQVADVNGQKVHKPINLSIQPPTIHAPGSLRLQYRTNLTKANSNQIAPHFRIQNAGLEPASMSEFSIRYYFTLPEMKAMTYWCDWAVVGCANVRNRFVESKGRIFFETSFTPEAGAISAGGTTGDLQLRFAKDDWSNFLQTDHYSFDPARTAFADWERVTLYHKGVLVWGVEPQF